MNHFTTNGSFSTFMHAARWLAPKLLILLLALIVVNVAATVILGKKLEHRLVAMRAKGEPVSVADLGRPRVPDSENAAINYQLAFQVIDSKSAKRDLATIGNFLKADNRRNNPAIWGEAESAVQRLQPVIPIVEEAVKRPKCKFPVNWSAGPSALFPHFSKMRYLSQILRATALIEARRGRMDQALHLIELDLQTSQALSDDPVLIGQLVRISMLNMGTKSLREIVNTGKINEPQAKRLSSLLTKIDLYPGFRKAMEGERAGGLWWYGPAPTAEFFTTVMNKPDNIVGKAFGHLIKSRLWRPFLYLDEMTYLDATGKQIKQTDLPWRELKNIKDPYDPWEDAPRYAIITRFAYMFVTRATARRDEGMTDVYGNRILLGLIAFKDRFGSYPANLDDLNTRLGWEVPKDPFSGKAFTYKRQGNGFVFYSFGQNLKDDHAKTIPGSSLPKIPRIPKGKAPDKAYFDAGNERAKYPYLMPGDRFSADMIWEMDH